MAKKKNSALDMVLNDPEVLKKLFSQMEHTNKFIDQVKALPKEYTIKVPLEYNPGDLTKFGGKTKALSNSNGDTILGVDYEYTVIDEGPVKNWGEIALESGDAAVVSGDKQACAFCGLDTYHEVEGIRVCYPCADVLEL